MPKLRYVIQSRLVDRDDVWSVWHDEAWSNDLNTALDFYISLKEKAKATDGLELRVIEVKEKTILKWRVK